jgi:RHS repeat-associated protein
VGLYREGRFYAVHSDHLGAPRYITDDTRRPVWQWPYSPFGNNKPSGLLMVTTDGGQVVRYKATSPQLAMPLRDPGQYDDPETGMRQNFHRYFRQSEGRYEQPDPTGLDGGLNLYVYVDGNPLRFIDPEGLQARGNVTPGGPGANLRWPSLGPNQPAPTYRVDQYNQNRGAMSRTSGSLLDFFAVNTNGTVTMRSTRDGSTMLETITASGTRLIYREGPNGPRLDIYSPSGSRETLHQEPVGGLCLRGK